MAETEAWLRGSKAIHVVRDLLLKMERKRATLTLVDGGQHIKSCDFKGHAD